MRNAAVQRNTKETRISINIELDGDGSGNISTGIGFMDHMLSLFAKHGMFNLEVKADGDLEVDAHHTMEDTGLALGEAIAKALGDKKSIRRYGKSLLPMDESLALVALDLSGRPYLVYNVPVKTDYIKDLDVALFKEFFQALCVKAGLNLHIKMLEAGETHHVFEAVFKGFARALREAVEIDAREKGVPSTKGVL